MPIPLSSSDRSATSPPQEISKTSPADKADPLKVPKGRHDLRILQSLRRIIRAVDLHSRRLAAEYKVTAPQLLCLVVVVEEGPLTATSISRQIHLSPSTIVGILDRLETKGLVRRDRDAKDRRLVNVTATDEGRSFVADAPSPLHDRLAEALLNLPDLEQATIALSLERIVDLMEAGGIEAAPMLATGTIDQITQAKPPEVKGGTKKP